MSRPGPRLYYLLGVCVCVVVVDVVFHYFHVTLMCLNCPFILHAQLFCFFFCHFHFLSGLKTRHWHYILCTSVMPVFKPLRELGSAKLKSWTLWCLMWRKKNAVITQHVSRVHWCSVTDLCFKSYWLLNKRVSLRTRGSGDPSSGCICNTEGSDISVIESYSACQNSIYGVVFPL